MGFIGKRPIITIVVGLWLFLAIPMVGQSSIEPAAACGASVEVPFDFWIGPSRFPAGQYRVECLLTTMVLFHNAEKNIHTQTFLMPTGDKVATGDYKLIFAMHDHQLYLQELWNSNGRAVLTLRLATMAPDDTTIEIPVNKTEPGKVAVNRDAPGDR